MSATDRLRAGHPGRSLFAVAALIFYLAWPAFAAALDLPPSQPGVYVYDLAHVWQPGTIQQAQLEIANIRARTGAEIAVVSWPSGQSEVSLETARQDALTIMDTWGVGQKGIDDGLVILFDLDTSLQHGQIYLYGGRGFLASYMSEADLQAVVDGSMLPPAKNGDLDGALLGGLAVVDRAVVPGGNPNRGAQDALDVAVAGLIVGGAVLILGAFGFVWWLRGRDARTALIDDSVLLPAPPPGLTPAMANVLTSERMGAQAFTSALVDLGHRGLVTFRQNDATKLRPRVDLVVPDPPLADASSIEARSRPLGEPEAHLAESIAAQTDGGVLTSERLRGGIGRKLTSSFQKELGKMAQDSGLFRTDPRRIVGRWHVIGGAVAIAAGVILRTAVLNSTKGSPDLFMPGREYLAFPVILLLSAGVVIVVLARFMPARTQLGAQTLAMALAYRNTLGYELAQAPTMNAAVAGTQSRMPWITTPDELTVWSVAFGLSKAVDALVKRSLATDATTGTAWAPLWYSGSAASVGDVGGMLGSIGTTGMSGSGGGYGGGGGGGGGGAGGGF